MEPEVHIIEKYFQNILQCFTMTNVRCKGGKEIDLLAVNPRTGEKYHVEARVATTPSFALRLKDTYTKSGIPHRKGLDFFKKAKFNHPIVKEKIREIFGDAEYSKILVVYQTHPSLSQKDVEQYDIKVWFIADLIRVLKQKGQMKGSRDDVLRVIELIRLVEEYERKHKRARARERASHQLRLSEVFIVTFRDNVFESNKNFSDTTNVEPL